MTQGAPDRQPMAAPPAPGALTPPDAAGTSVDGDPAHSAQNAGNAAHLAPPPGEPLALNAPKGRDYPGARWFRLRRLIVLAAVLALVPVTLFSARPFTADSSAGRAVAIAAWVCLGCGLLWRGYAILHIAGAKGHRLVASGPYAMCRHPLYLGSSLAALGIVLLSAAPIAWAGYLLLAVGTYARTVAFEEHRLHVNYPEEMTAYCAAVPMLVPRRLRLQAPEVLPPGLPLLKETLTQLGFFSAALAMQALVYISHALALPTPLRLW